MTVAKAGERGLVLILALDEEASIAQVIADVRAACPECDVLVVDGESRDQTAKIVRETGTWLISIPPSLGVSGAMEAGLLFAREYDYRFVLRIDADGQHPAAQAGRLLSPILSGGADFVIGSRFADTSNSYSASFARSIAIRIFSFLVSLTVHQRISDPTSGFQALERKLIAYLTSIDGFEYSEIETLVVLGRAGFRILEVPVAMIPRQAGKTNFTMVRIFYYMFLGLFSLALGVLRKVDKGGIHER